MNRSLLVQLSRLLQFLKLIIKLTVRLLPTRGENLEDWLRRQVGTNPLFIVLVATLFGVCPMLGLYWQHDVWPRWSSAIGSAVEEWRKPIRQSRCAALTAGHVGSVISGSPLLLIVAILLFAVFVFVVARVVAKYRQGWRITLIATAVLGLILGACVTWQGTLISAMLAGLLKVILQCPPA